MSYQPKRLESWVASVEGLLKTHGVACGACFALLRELAGRAGTLPFARDYSARVEPGALTARSLKLDFRLDAGGPLFLEFFREPYSDAGGTYRGACRECGRMWEHADMMPAHSAAGVLVIGFEASAERAAKAADVAATSSVSLFSAAERAHFIWNGRGSKPPRRPQPPSHVLPGDLEGGAAPDPSAPGDDNC